MEKRIKMCYAIYQQTEIHGLRRVNYAFCNSESNAFKSDN